MNDVLPCLGPIIFNCCHKPRHIGKVVHVKVLIPILRTFDICVGICGCVSVCIPSGLRISIDFRDRHQTISFSILCDLIGGLSYFINKGVCVLLVIVF